jgi:phage antirepressor YoqD-like protein
VKKESMTVKDVSIALNVSDRTVRRHAAELFPESVQNGKKTTLNAMQVTRIKQQIEKSGRNDLDNVGQVGSTTTDLEMMERTVSVLQWMSNKMQRLKEENEMLIPKGEAFDRFLNMSGTQTLTAVAKELQLHPRKMIDRMKSDKILYYIGKEIVPNQDYQNRGWFEVKAIAYSENEGSALTSQTRVTPKGIEELRKLYGKDVDLVMPDERKEMLEENASKR